MKPSLSLLIALGLVAFVLAALPAQAQTSAAEITQVGTLHQATVTQNGGTGLSPLSVQINQDGGTSNVAAVTQTLGGESDPGALIAQVGGAGYVALSATIDQIGGAYNDAAQYQAAEGNSAAITQDGGAYNVARQVQSQGLPLGELLALLPGRFAAQAVSTGIGLLSFGEDGGHAATITQNGTEDSHAWQWQQGIGHEATITQNGGADNLALQVQFGARHWSKIVQEGASNEAVVFQANALNPTARHVSLISQHGSGNRAVVRQTSY